MDNNEGRAVFVGDIAFNKDITPQADKTSIGAAAYYCAVGAVAASIGEGLAFLRISGQRALFSVTLPKNNLGLE